MLPQALIVATTSSLPLDESDDFDDVLHAVAIPTSATAHAVAATARLLKTRPAILQPSSDLEIENHYQQRNSPSTHFQAESEPGIHTNQQAAEHITQPEN
ncbi:hypothetical protein [Nocardia sp. NPDC046763]|uniref:hypothetical protein n=1 Tax=Nocardia sp. NPDC046763 TaxID=3155256 RepID=UPI0033ED20DB